MNRRDALQRVAWLMGGSISAPALFGILNGYAADAADATTAKLPATSRPQFLDDTQVAVVAEIAEIMIPRTSTPGAKDVGVPSFIDSMLKEVYPTADQQRYLRGLSEFQAAAQREHGHSFLELDGEHRAGLVAAVHDSAVAEELQHRAAHTVAERPFILMTKELCMLGFFTSEVGATQVLQYVAIPGSYHGCIPLADAGNGKTWARESFYPF